MVVRMKSKIACFAGPSLHDGSKSFVVAVCARVDTGSSGPDKRRQQRQRREQNATVDTGARCDRVHVRNGRFMLARRVLFGPPAAWLLPFAVPEHLLDLLLYRIEVEGRRVLHRRIIDRRRCQLLDKLLDHDEAPELTGEEVVT